MQIVSLGLNYHTIQPRKNNNIKKSSDFNITNTESFVGANILANQNIAFMSKNISKPIPKYDKNLVADNKEGNESYFLSVNPERFYVLNGLQINNFLRKGELSELYEIDETVPEVLRPYMESKNEESRSFNRAVVDSIEVLDKMMNSRTDEAKIVYRYAPTSWLATAQNGILEDKGFFSTTTKMGSTSEAYIGDEPKTCFKVQVPEGMPYLDLTSHGENELLFPRGLKFKVLDNENIVMMKEEII